MAAAPSEVKFQGGLTQECALSLHRQLGRSYFGTTTGLSQPAFAFSFAEASELDTGLSKFLGLDVRTDDRLVLASARELPRLLCDMYGKPSHIVQSWSFGDSSVAMQVAGGKVRDRFEGGHSLGVWRIAQMSFSKPLDVHWMVQCFVVSFKFDEMTEDDFLRSVAHVGTGTFADTKEELRIELDVAKFQRLWASSFRNASKRSKNEAMTDRMKLFADALDQVSAATMTELMKKPRNWHDFEISAATPLGKLAASVVQAYFDGGDIPTDEATAAFARAERDIRAQLRSMARVDLPLRIRLGSSHTIRLLIATEKPSLSIPIDGTY